MSEQILRELKGGAKRLRSALVTSRRMIYTPKPTLSISQWANKFAFLSPETSAPGGQVHGLRLPDSHHGRDRGSICEDGLGHEERPDRIHEGDRQRDRLLYRAGFLADFGGPTED